MELVKANRRRIKNWFAEYKRNSACERCGEENPACLDYHHIFPEEKYKEVSTMVNDACSIERIEAEIAKCECICANCHRKLHAPVAER